MTKRKIVGIFFFCLLISQIAIFCMNIPGVIALINNKSLSEGFETWNPNGWTGSAVHRLAAAAYSGVYGQRFTDADGVTAYLENEFEPNMGIAYVSFMFRANSLNFPSSPAAPRYIFTTYDSWGDWIITIGITKNATGFFFWFNTNLFDDGDISFLQLTTGTWYQIKASYRNATNGLVSLSVNGVNYYSHFGNTVVYGDDDDGIDVVDIGKGSGVLGDTYSIDYDAISLQQCAVSADLEPDSSGVDWVFTDWRYYTFTVEIPAANLDVVYLGFTEIKCQNGTINFAAWANSSSWDCLSSYFGRDNQPIMVQQGSWSNGSTGTTITFPLWFTKACLSIYLDSAAVDVYVWFNDTTGYETGWMDVAPNLFRIYNEGGFSTQSTFTGNAGVLPGGRDFSMFAYNNSYAYKDMIWRDLQHIKMLPVINFRAGLQTFYYWCGIDYMLKNGSWRTGLNLQLEPDVVAYTGVFASNVWINMTASWYYNNSLVKQDNLYMFYHGEVYNAPDPGRWSFWIDFWFDSGNASTLLGGRINAYEYPMKDDSAVWLRWLSSNWGVKDDVEKQSECLMPLYDSGGNIISSEQIAFVKIHSALSVIPYNASQYVAITGFDTFDTTYSNEPTLKGIQTPPWDETKMPVMANTGLLGAIWSMFAGIGKWLSDNILFGGLSLWPTFVAFLDTIAGWFGFPNGFSNLISWLSNGWNWLVQSFTYALTVIYDIFLFLGSVIGMILTTLGEALVSFINMLSMISSMISGGLGTAGNLWNQLGLTQWITVAILFYPLYLIILWDQEGMDAVVKQLSMIIGILTWLKDLFIGLISLVLDLVGRIIESIPVVE